MIPSSSSNSLKSTAYRRATCDPKMYNSPASFHRGKLPYCVIGRSSIRKDSQVDVSMSSTHLELVVSERSQPTKLTTLARTAPSGDHAGAPASTQPSTGNSRRTSPLSKSRITVAALTPAAASKRLTTTCVPSGEMPGYSTP